MIETAGGPALTLALLGAAGPQPYEQREALRVLIGHVRSNAEFTAKKTETFSAKQWLMATLLGRHRDRYPAPASSAWN